MFCVFLQNSTPKNDLLVKFIHNENIYTFSRNLSFRHSPVLADLILKNEDNAINLEYIHKFDDFQLICDLFNYKRVFITHRNIDFLEFIANLLQIQVLIKKVTKFRNHYNEFIKNPIFKKIDLLHHQIFSISQHLIASKNISDSDYDDIDGNEVDINLNDNNTDLINGQSITPNNNNEIKINLKNINDDEISEEKKINIKFKNNHIDNENGNKNKTEEEDKQDNKNDDSEKNQNQNDDIMQLHDESDFDHDYDIPTIKYDKEYSTTVSHLIFSALFSNPLNFDKYLPIVIKDKLLFNDFIEAMTSSPLSSSFVEYLIDPIIKRLEGEDTAIMQLKEKILKYQLDSNLSVRQLDTNLDIYLNDIGYFFREHYEFYQKYKFLNDLIEKDDIDNFQLNFTSNPKISTNKTVFINFFKTSMITSSIKCFKYFVLNWGSHSSTFKVDAKMIHSAIIGGNMEIIRFMLDKYNGSTVNFVNDSILFNRNELFQWFIENKCHFLSFYNSCCTKIFNGEKYIKQKWYRCKECHRHHNNGCCRFCAKHCHLDRDAENSHKIEFKYISTSCFCDDECELSKNIEIVGNKEIVEIDDLILLAFYCMNTKAIKILIKEGGYILRCRDRLTKSSYSLNDSKLKEIIMRMKGYKENLLEEKINNTYFLPFLYSSYSDYSEDDDDENNNNNEFPMIPFLAPVDVGNQNNGTENNDN